MIDEKILLQELDEMIKIQQKSVERAEQGSNEAVVRVQRARSIHESKKPDKRKKCPRSGNSIRHTVK